MQRGGQSPLAIVSASNQNSVLTLKRRLLQIISPRKLHSFANRHARSKGSAETRKCEKFAAVKEKLRLLYTTVLTVFYTVR